MLRLPLADDSCNIPCRAERREVDTKAANIHPLFTHTSMVGIHCIAKELCSSIFGRWHTNGPCQSIMPITGTKDIINDTVLEKGRANY